MPDNGSLYLNRWAVPVSAAGRAQVSSASAARYSRSDDGDLQLSRRWTKGAWAFETTPMRETEARFLEALLQGRGQVWPFDGNIYAQSGLGPDAASPVYGLRDDSEIVESVSTFYAGSRFGVGALSIERAVTNLFAQNVRTGTDTSSATTGFTAVAGGVLTSDTTQFWQGARSLKVVGASAGDGVYAEKTGVAAGACVGFVYLYSATAATLEVYLNDADNGDGTKRNIECTAGDWIRVECTVTVGATGTVRLYVKCRTTGSTFFADGWQLASAATASTWVDGTRNGNDLAYYLGGLRKRDDVTVMFWTRGPTVVSANTPTAFTLGLVGGDALQLRWQSGTTLNFRLMVGGAVTLEATYVANPWSDFDWHHVACVFRRAPLTGEHNLTLYIDGVSVATDDTPANLPDLSRATLQVGDSSTPGTDYWQGLFDEFAVFYAAAPAAFITAAYEYRLSPLPRLDAHGGFLHMGDAANTQETIEVAGVAEPVLTPETGVHADASAAEVLYRVGFEIEEV